ncbi:BRCA1-associated RING domain protein 1 isoform 2-T2 [Anomaloglossus baeobatrachus]|uniref:BRCA1-associated RING domain protein 1 isoform X2 n=1 Tax=Anomaloglossus baeobatrachus TaxID=238106 RepID=UPI003F509544
MPLKVRSGNRPADTTAMNKEISDWSRTRTALLELEDRLRCSVCSSLLKEPVCLGGCEHVFCRTCVDGSVGNECPVCQTPAWVKDAQINRQLDTMIQLCSKLHNLLDKTSNDGNKMDLCQDASLIENTTVGESKKKQIKMWFSPRRRKVRYVLEREENGQPLPSNSKQTPLVSAYEFVSSSPNVEPGRKKTVKSRKSKKKLLKDINQKWGIGTDHLKENDNQESNRSVSFCTPPHVLYTPEDLQESNQECKELIKQSPEKMELELENHEENNTTEINNLKESQSVISAPYTGTGQENDHDLNEENGQTSQPVKSVEEQASGEKLLQFTRLKNISSGRTKREGTPLKRKDYPIVSPNSSATKRPRKAKVADDSKSEDDTGDLGKVRNSPRVETTPKNHFTPLSPKDGRRKCQLGTNVQTSPSSISFMKKNHKGETMLHVASIKGDLQAVMDLLKSGANPNVKDHAGWTPLHEACNHGHTDVVELLLRHQALVNTTGYQNDSPLHDAVRNGHISIVRLLLQHGAVQDAVNIFGLRPVDYAETEEIKSALLQTQTKQQLHSPGPTKSVQCREGSLVILGSGLSPSQKTDLDKLVPLLKAEVSLTFNNSVTHVIAGDKPVLRTMKCMMGILSGGWILRCAWVTTCLQTRRREPEELHEVDGGPHRARLNREQLLPGLLDGCHFYFLGCFKEHRKEDLVDLVKAAGGQILIRQPKPDSDVTQTINTVAYHADADSDQRFCTQYVIYDKTSKFTPRRVRQGKVWFAPSNWLIECITSFLLLPVPQT